MASLSDVLGDRAPTFCDRADAHGVAFGFNEVGTTGTFMPFRHPELQPNEIRIRVTNTGLCHSDAFSADGSWGPFSAAPLIPGHEIVGVVEKLGSAVVGFSEGERVGFGCFRGCCETCEFCRTGKDVFCLQKKLTYGPNIGGYATSFQANSSHFFKIPESYQGHVAPMFCAGLTVYRPLNHWGRSGMKVAIGGIGGLGHVALQFANKMGMEVTALSTSNAKEAEARQFGAHHFLNVRDENAVKESMFKFDLVVQTATVYSVKDTLSLVKPGGVLNLCGIPPAGTDVDFNLPSLFYFNRILTGNSVGSRIECQSMLDFSALHGIYPQCEEYSFADFQTAFNSLSRSEPHAPRYRAVVETASYFQDFTPKND